MTLKFAARELRWSHTCGRAGITFTPRLIPIQVMKDIWKCIVGRVDCDLRKYPHVFVIPTKSTSASALKPLTAMPLDFSACTVTHPLVTLSFHSAFILIHSNVTSFFFCIPTSTQMNKPPHHGCQSHSGGAHWIITPKAGRYINEAHTRKAQTAFYTRKWHSYFHLNINVEFRNEFALHYSY